MAVIDTIRGSPAVQDVERDVAWGRTEHHKAALAQRRLVAAVTEGTLLQPAGQVNT